MKIQSIHDKILKLGGTAEIKNDTRRRSPSMYLEGILNGYDIHMSTNSDGTQDYYTVRAIHNRDEYDMGADYNPGGFIFCRRVKDLDAVAQEWDNGK